MTNQKEKGYNNFDVTFFGDKEEWQRIKAQIDTSDIEDLYFFAGYSNSLSKELNSFDVGISASEGESFGLAVVEYMAHGMATIGAESGATPEIITEGTGLLYVPGDIGELSSNMELFIKNNDCIYSMGKYAQKYAIDRFSINNCARNIFQIYEQV